MMRMTPLISASGRETSSTSSCQPRTTDATSVFSGLKSNGFSVRPQYAIYEAVTVAIEAVGIRTVRNPIFGPAAQVEPGQVRHGADPGHFSPHLDRRIEQELSRPGASDIEIQRLKRAKLRLKEEIVKMEGGTAARH